MRAAQGTILAAGGFEWNEELITQFVAGPVSHPISCPTNEGDTLTMARAIGADLANMWDLWRFPSAAIPGEEYGGKPLSRMVAGERALPGAIMVNQKGTRFVNEAHPYTDIGRTFMTWDPVQSGYENYPAWAIFDRDFRDTYSVLTLTPNDPDPPWLTRADSLDELAKLLGIEPAACWSRRWNTSTEWWTRVAMSTSAAARAPSTATTPTSATSPAPPWASSAGRPTTP